MAHEHIHGPANYDRAFAIGIGLNVGFVVAEAALGVAANSLALLADAGHNLSDVLGLLLAWGASYLARRRPTERRTYGLRRSSILAALLNAVLLLVAVGAITWEAVGRLVRPAPVAGGTVIAVAAVGKVPFVSTFGKFVTRGYDQLEMGLVSRFNLKVVGSRVGVSLASDGPSQMALPDVAYFRAWTTVRGRTGQPVLYLLNPTDAYAAYALTLAMAEHDGACYLRTLRPDVPFLYDDNTRFPLGGHQVLAHGHDLLVVASGHMVHEAKKALAKLQDEGLQATLVDLYSVPFDGAARTWPRRTAAAC